MTTEARFRPLLLGLGWFPDQPGGLNRYVHDLHRALRTAGFEALTHVLGPAADLPDGVTAAGSRDDVLPARLVRYAAGARRLAEPATVVDAHFALSALLPVVAGPLRRLPLVVHFHGPWSQENLGGSRTPAAAAKRLVERAVYRRARETIVLSGAFRRLLIEGYGASPWNVHLVPPGVDLERFQPADNEDARRELGLPVDAWVAVTARRLVPRMGLTVLLRAWRGFVDVRGGAVLLVVGDGPLRSELEKCADELGVAESVRFLGRVDDDDLVRCYRAADVCVVPSVALEGFGLVVLEALACGTPVVGTDVGGLPEILGRLDASLVVPADDATALGRRLLEAWQGSKPLPSAARCRSFAEEFSWSEVARRHGEIYRRAARPRARDRPRVIYVDHCARLSGGELALLRLLGVLQGVDAHVVLAEDGPLVRKLLDAGISVEVLPMNANARELPRARVTPRRMPLESAATAAAYAARLAVRLRRLRPDLVHTNSLKAALYGGVAGRLAGIPVVWHVRDRIADDYLPDPAVRLIRQAARRLPTAIIANSRATLATVGDPARRIGRVIPSPSVVYDSYSAGPNGARGDRSVRRIGIVGRLAPWKGQHVFLEAFARAFDRGPEEAVIVGSPLFGEESYEAELHRLAARLGIAERVTFTGFRDDVWRELGELDVFAHASVVPEPFGQVVIEAMAAGLPVVASGAGGPAEIVEDGVDGLLYPPGDVDALAERLRLLAGDSRLRARLGASARESARRFSPEAAAAQVLGVYEEVLSRT